MKKILYCNDKIKPGVQVYADLRAYYQGLAQAHQTDTALVKASKEMATKCLVRQASFPNAITEYENVVNTSHDTMQVLCSQLNIVETYMIMQSNNGGMSAFTGKHKELKPETKKEGIMMINMLLHHIKQYSKAAIIPKVFSLSQNYPNPFNPTTTIKYDLPIASKVNIKIYDILGRIVKELVNENKDAGSYTVSFDGSNFASGVYFYRIEADENNGKKFVNSKKMVLVK